mmetsp:Transcript_21975/g.30591  ORF Transcript_21975/g.30591 Transcript_21975/m.30591 type:complete len:307 (+) Transcript_21975:79-999(+)
MDDLLATIGLCFSRIIQVYLILVFIFPLVAVNQERQIWARSDAVPSLSLIGYIKVYLLNLLWMGFHLIGCIVTVPKWLFGGMGNAAEHEANMVVYLSGLFLTSIIISPVEVRGRENLPPDSFSESQVAPVYIANHSSTADAAVVYHLGRSLRWIAKESIALVPGVGVSMVLGQHIRIKRKGKNKSSVQDLYEKSDNALQSGKAMMIFPQGTRRISERLPFKDGAFKIAMKNKATIVPVSINTPMTVWNDLYPLNRLWGGKSEPIVITVHKQIPVKGDEDKEKLKETCFNVIYSVLPEIGEADKKEK